MGPGHPLVVVEEAVDDAEEEGGARQTGTEIIEIIMNVRQTGLSDNLTVTTAKCRNGKRKNIGEREGLGEPFSCVDFFSKTLVSFSLMNDDLRVESITEDDVDGDGEDDGEGDGDGEAPG